VSERPYTCCVFLSDLSEDKKGLGPVSITKLEALREIVKTHKLKISDVVLTAGVHPDEQMKDNTETGAKMMKRWLVQEGSFKPEQIHTTTLRDNWTTWSEIMEMFQIIEKNNLPHDVLYVSNKRHMFPRIFMTLFVLRPHGWYFKYLGT
jgi:2-iminoacetate synthase ThiH